MRGGPPNAKMEKVHLKNTKSTILRLLSYLTKQKFLVSLAFLFVVMNSTLTIVASYMVRPIINGIMEQSGMEALLRNLLIMALIYVVAGISSYLQSRIMLEVAQKALYQLRIDLFTKLEKLPLSYFDRNQTGGLMSRFTNDVDAISQMLSNTGVQLLSGIITLLTTLGVMFYTNWILTIVTITVAPLCSIATKAISRRTMRYYKHQQEAIGNLNGFIEEHIAGQKVIKVFNREGQVSEEFDTLNQAYKQNSFMADFLSGTMGPIMGALGLFGYVITAGVGGLLCVFRGFDIGGYTIFVNYAKSFSRPISDIFMQVNTIFLALAGAERVFEIMDEEPEGDCTEGNVITGGMQGKIVFDHVDFAYHKGQLVLRDISLEAPISSKIAFVGSTGAGKTTITNLLNRFYEIKSGTIAIDGIDISTMNKEYLRNNIAMVLQDTHLFTGTVMENIRYGRLDATDEEVKVAAVASNADYFIRRLEHGYDTILEGDGGNLSQGQRQLLNIARAAVSKAPILVLDEATSSVDTRTERHIEEALDRLMESRTTFVIAHRLSTVRNADCIFVLEHGRVIEQGNHEKLLELKGNYYNLCTGNLQLV